MHQAAVERIPRQIDVKCKGNEIHSNEANRPPKTWVQESVHSLDGEESEQEDKESGSPEENKGRSTRSRADGAKSADKR
jgi:hypothetical protein